MRTGFDAPPVSIKPSQLAELYGVRWFHVYLLLCLSLTVAVGAAALNSTPYMLEAIIREFQISDEEAPLAISITYGGSIFGVFLGGRLSDVIGRRKAMIAFTLMMMLLGLSHEAIPHNDGFEVLLLIRFLLGLPYGGMLAMQAPMAMEFFPDYARGTAAAMIGLGYNVGNLYLLSFVPTGGPATSRWRFYFAVAPVPPCILCLGMLYFLPESPRWLLTQGRLKEAQESLNDVTASWPIIGTACVGPAPDIDTMDLDKLGEQTLAEVTTRKSLQILFSSSLLWTTAITSLVYMFLAGPSNVLSTWGPVILEAILGKTPPESLYRVSEIFGASGVIASVLLIDQLSRKALLATSFVLLAGCYALLVYSGPDAYEYLVVAWTISRFFDSLIWNVVTIFCSEAFPTLLRGTASGFVMILGRVASVCMPVWAGLYIGVSEKMLVATIAIMTLASAVLSTAIPREMTCQPMDDIPDDVAESIPLTSSKSSTNNP